MTQHIKRIYDQPDHPHYGPVRRLHIMLMQLFGDQLTNTENMLHKLVLDDWDSYLVTLIEDGMNEAKAQREVLRSIL